ncbi:MAG TPA: right-handed parallel beta-helix repeat-containing protein [Chitinophagaceae bacterium]|nr:right-handed parallel beta-helix repeat-containing protein [Chitinophagaceae bacterium]
MKIFLSIVLLSLLFLTACRKENFITSPDARVVLSADTLKYDTVFTTTGSVTQSFKIINDNNQKLRISSIKLMGGASSVFSMNVDGLAATEATNLEVAARDSLYVFVQVRVDPSADDLPFVARDSIVIAYNGVEKKVQLEAWGQNAHFFRNKEIISDETWSNDLPYVVLGYLYVAPGVTLTLQKGVRIYAHADAPVIIDGSLQANGEKDTANRIYFQGDRLDQPYSDYPAAWPGIYFREGSGDNVLNHVVIKNAYQGIVTEGPSPNASPKITLNQCIIDNAYDAGILGSRSSITATNCLVSNCGKNIVLEKGGSYDFTHCTVVAYSNSYINHKDPVLLVTDANAAMATSALFRNCIFWGESGAVDDEVVLDKKTAQPFSVTFDQVLWKVKELPPAATIVAPQPINNQPPVFDSIDVSRRIYRFYLQGTSPALNAGKVTGTGIDLDGNPRPVGLPDLGCYERQ